MRAKFKGKSVAKEVEEALIETAKEADRQKKFVERQSNNLQHRLEVIKNESSSMSKRRLAENSKLLYECNDLRGEVKMLTRKLEVRKGEMDELHHRISDLEYHLMLAKTAT